MMDRLKYTLVWLAISVLVGALAHHFFRLGLWWSAVIAGLALIANGFIATWEDRGTFND